MENALRLLAFILCSFFLSGLLAQDEIARARVLVPYNDHGQWGYSDTLGNMVYKARYEKAGFYFRRMMNGNETYISRVNTAWGENLLQANGKLLLPKKTHFVKFLYSKAAPGTLLILQKKGQYGIYELDKGWLTTAKFDTLFRHTYNDWVLLRGASDPTYTHFNPKTLKTEVTGFVSVEEYWSAMNTVVIATTADRKHYQLTSGGEKTLLSPEEFAKMESLDGLMIEELADDWDQAYHWRGPRPSAAELGVDKATDYRDYSSLSFAEKYGFTAAIIAQKDGKYGMVDRKGNVLLPFEYDGIRFSDPATEAKLHKNGKVGYKILFTHHPTIEPKYDVLDPAYHLPVSSGWSFGIFRVKINGQTAYVGENAVEYFDFE